MPEVRKIIAEIRIMYCLCPLSQNQYWGALTLSQSIVVASISGNHDLDDTHMRSINFAGGVSEGIPAESTEIRSEVHKTGFKTMALNIFSLVPRLDELRIFVSEQRPNIICITETKIDSTIDNSHVGIDDYVVVRNDRNRHGGGVAMYTPLAKLLARCARLGRTRYGSGNHAEIYLSISATNQRQIS